MGEQPEPFDWDDYLVPADELALRTGSESARRSAISRACYAVLGRAADLLRSEGRAASTHRTHADVWMAFRNSSDERRKRIADGLDRLRRLRNAADYDRAFANGLPGVVGDAVDTAAVLLRALDDVRSVPG